MEPMDRNMRTSVIPHVMSVLVLPNVLLRLVTERETEKKSNASHVCGIELVYYSRRVLRLQAYPGCKSDKEKRPLLGVQHAQ
jgi:hypothetical protein